jgi:hypothetical protein
MDIDQEGFYTQRLLAREWFDWLVIAGFDGMLYGMYGAHSESAFAFGTGTGRRWIAPSPTIINALEANQLLIRPRIKEACAHFALGEVGCGMLGINEKIFSLGTYHQTKASRLASAITAEIDTNGDGKGEWFINLSKCVTFQA